MKTRSKRKRPAVVDRRFFPQFPKLPEQVRCMIWQHVASFPRVVGILEKHYEKRPFDEDSDETRMLTTTRPPVLLSICRESRRIGLEVYSRIDKDVLRWPSSPSDPAYVNADVDIIYRGKKSCRKGDAFRIRCKDWTEDVMPIAFTHTIAVDVMAVTRPRELPQLPSRKIRRYDSKKEADQLIESLTKALRTETMFEVGLCSEKGLLEIIFVVGNDDDLSEVTLIPLHQGHIHGSGREKVAVDAVEEFTQELARYWSEKEIEHRIPDVRIMTIQRKPLESFEFFPRLPMELQLQIWEFASQVSRVTTITHMPGAAEEYDAQRNRARAIAHTSQASRSVSDKVFMFSEIEYPVFFDDAVDIALLVSRFDEYRAFCRLGVKSIGILHENRFLSFSAADAKTFVGLERVFVFVGKLPNRCETTVEPIPEERTDSYALPVSQWSIVQRASFYVKYLRGEMVKASKKWKAYQRRREKIGKSSPDWTPPEVILARPKPISEAQCPYSY